ncbi:MAG: N-6 DNA methylase [Bacteroidales bacterium]|nr:N-6 DNA methylase [Bacteroidales bacterium]
MSKVLIHQYYTNIQRATQFGKSRNETAIRNHTWNLLNGYAHKKNYEVVTELACLGTRGKKVYPDGILKNNWGLDMGYWESKDEKDVIDDEIDAKINKGYPLTNILFEDTQTAVLYQYGQEVMRVPVDDAEQLDALLDQFIEYKSESVHKFESALEIFKADIPNILSTLRDKIEKKGESNTDYIPARDAFHELCRVEINPDITLADIREMMIQHILTSDIFNKIFDDPDFHHHNSIARELEKLIDILFTWSERRNLLGSIEHYYDAINSTAASITDHHEKQKFLKVLYENFYKVYNPKAADRLGVVYTPNEIVRFMVQGTDYLLEKHFGKTLADEGVEILDPAVGTGTFLCEIIEQIPPQHLIKKYRNEIHANEVAILPYYIANLNIEYTFKQKMGYYEEFPNLCFVDTLDNTGGLSYRGQQHTLFGLSSENSERIIRQNQKKISVIIGNPPYNANQKNENENNKNREYLTIDKRIKDTYVKLSTAQKTKVYDMYARFYRWAMDRLDRNGIIAFISNRSFIDSRTFDGFRKWINDNFDEVYIIDTKSDVRANPKIAGTTHNVFGIQTGVAIMFLIQKEKQENKCKFNYVALEDNWRKQEKLEWLKNQRFIDIDFKEISPDKNHNWIDLTEEEWNDLIAVSLRSIKTYTSIQSIFKFSSNGYAGGRDYWMIDLNTENLQNKVQHLIAYYNAEVDRYIENEASVKSIDDFIGYDIKWTADLKKLLAKKIKIQYDKDLIIQSDYRPFIRRLFYGSYELNDRLTSNHYAIFGKTLKEENIVITFSGLSSNKPFQVLSVVTIFSYDFLEKTQCLPLFTYQKDGHRICNITDCSFEQFQDYYQDPSIAKEDIFYYVYGVLHYPAYQKKYKINLKREFPRIPFYEDFRQWAAWGKALMELHIHFETVARYELEVIERQEEKPLRVFQPEMYADAAEPEQPYAYQPRLKVKLKANKEAGFIEIDEMTTLKGIPPEAWEYKLGNRSALEWILDQYKEKKPSDPTIAEKFNTYRFTDYKDQVIDLLKRVCTVSVETMKIIREMEKTSS